MYFTGNRSGKKAQQCHSQRSERNGTALPGTSFSLDVKAAPCNWGSSSGAEIWETQSGSLTTMCSFQHGPGLPPGFWESVFNARGLQCLVAEQDSRDDSPRPDGRSLALLASTPGPRGTTRLPRALVGKYRKTVWNTVYEPAG